MTSPPPTYQPVTIASGIRAAAASRPDKTAFAWEERGSRHAPGDPGETAVGFPDDYWGEAITAFVVLRRRARASEKELLAHCEQSLARYKPPKTFIFVDALSRNAAGKVLKTELRQIGRT